VVAVSADTLGAWVVRCNPKLRDLHGLLRPGASPIGSWCVAANYRSQMMRRGDVILLWVSGQDRAFPRGFWGRGTVLGTAGPEDDVVEPSARRQLHAPIELRIHPDDAITDRELRAAGIDDLEVQRQPQGSNPSWVSRAQLARIDRTRSDR